MNLKFQASPVLQGLHNVPNYSNPETERQFVSALRKNVNSYFKDNSIPIKGNFNVILQSIAMLSFYILPFIIILIIPMKSWVGVFPAFVMGMGIAGIGMCVMHDALHGSFSRKEWVNKLFGGTLYLLGGNVTNWKIQHNVLHHTYTNIEGNDDDIGARGPIRLSENAPLRKIHHYQYIHAFFFYGLLTFLWLFKDFVQLARYNKTGITQRYVTNPKIEYVKMVTLKMAYLALFIGLPILITSFTWWQVIIGFLIMHLVAGFTLSIIFQMAHVVEGAQQPLPDANGTIHHEWLVHELLTTSDFARNNRLLNWCVGGLNFQIEHHLFPYICHVHYRKLAPIVERTANEFGFSYNLKPNFRKAIASHIRRLKELGKQTKN